MDLWIRSQDKELLVNAKAFELQHYKNSPCQIFAVWNNNFMHIGTYRTKERAIEVLDEIQNILKPKYILNTSNIKPDGVIFQNYDANVEIKELSTFVYQMPKD